MAIKRCLSIVLLVVVMLNFMGCLGVEPYSEVHLSAYEGRWLYTGSRYKSDSTFYNLEYLYLYSDSTFNCTFSYIFNQDSAASLQTVEGSWYPHKVLGCRYVLGWIELHFITDNYDKLWQVEGNKNDSTMTWFVYNSEKSSIKEFYWKLEN